MLTKKFLIKVFVAITYLGMVTVNFLANALPLNNRSTGAISDAYPNLFAPAGLTFSIWGLIYLLLAGYTLYQFGAFQKDKGKKNKELFNKVGFYFIISSLANILWIFSWHYDFIAVSVLLMLVILFSLIKIADILRVERLSLKDKFFIKLPFSIYFGWITVATIANITVFLISLNWNGFGLSDTFWTMLILVVGALIGVARMLKDKNIAYGLVLVWAYSGILLKHISASGFNKQYPEIIYTVWACILLFLISLFFVIKENKK